MNILEYADAINKDINIMYYANQGGRFCASIDFVDIKIDCVIESVHGNGKTPILALNDFTQKISGKTIIVGKYGHEDKFTRLVYQVPTLTKIDSGSELLAVYGK